MKSFFFFQRTTSFPKIMPRCLQPWEYVFIRADGNVVPCCAVFSLEKGEIMGNIFREEFNDIWLGERFRKFRRTSASGSNRLCRICPYY